MRWMFASAVALLVMATPALAATWHVAMNGDDSAAGTPTAPWRTAQHAADRVTAGDTVIVHAGTYAGFIVTKLGTEAQPIAFVANGAVTIDGAQTVDRDAILVAGGAWIRIEGFHVTAARRAGIAALDCHHITVRNNRADANARWGVFSSFCDDFVVEGNELSRSVSEHGVYASNSADRPVIRNNTIWGNGVCGVHLNGDLAFGGDGVISGAVIEGNVITDNGRRGGSGINGDGITGAVIRNNVLDGNHASGISLYREDGGLPSTGNQVINNTVRQAADGRWALNLQNASGGNVVRNNILLHPSPARGAIDACAECTAGMVSDHNAVVGRFSIGGTLADLGAWRTATGGDAATFEATDAELFEADSLVLRAGSPAIDAGSAMGAPAADIAGTPRPQGAGVDLGAYERESTDPGEPFVGPVGEEPEDEDMVSSGGCDAGRPGGGIVICIALIAVRRRQGRLR